MRIDFEGEDVTVRFGEGEEAFAPKVGVYQTVALQVVLDPEEVRVVTVQVPLPFSTADLDRLIVALATVRGQLPELVQKGG
jgi:hypothetical protein